jgi:polysaccharide export outer membrane protein
MAQTSVPPPGTTQPQTAPSSAQVHPRETVVVTAHVPPGTPRNGPYRLGTGDKVRVTVFGEDDLSGEFQVDGSGFVALPLIGTVKAQDLTSDQLAAVITDRLQDGYLIAPRVTVAVSTYRPFYIIGQVNKPGEYPYVNDMSALNAVALAGGYTDAANETSIYVRSVGDTDEHSEPADSTTQIHPGDVVRVPKSAFAAVVQVLGPLAGIIGLSYGYANVH